MMNLIDGIKLDTYNLFLPYSLTRDAVLSALTKSGAKIDSVREGFYGLQSSMFDCSILCNIMIVFDIENIKSLHIAPATQESDVISAFKMVQQILLTALGKPNYSLMQTINNIIGYDKVYRWRFKSAEICHCLEERFGYSHTITIQIS